MDAEFWHERWANNEIGFHGSEVHPLFKSLFSRLNLDANSRVFVPLCGKTLDIGWLLSQGHRVVGVELSDVAIEQLFSDLELKPEVKVVGDLIHYSAESLDVWAGDFFALTAEILGEVDAIYDRAALVALPEEMRIQYVQHLMGIANKASQLLITFDYDQSQMPGPPFCVGEDEVQRHYGSDYGLTLLESVDVSGGLKGQATANENVWLLEREG